MTPPDETASVLRMHEAEVRTDPGLVRRLLAAQCPEWAALPLAAVPSSGTDNAIYRLGDDLVVRLPRIGWAVAQVEKEHVWLSRLAPSLPLLVPQPLVQGAPGEGYPYPWSVYRWLDGENLGPEALEQPQRAALALADFLTALQRLDTTGGPFAAEHGLRGVPLVSRDDGVRDAIRALPGLLDQQAATAAWERALEAPGYSGAPVWFHGDVLPGNLLFRQGRLGAVIDFGGLGVGDPACDLMIAWSLFAGESRQAFRAAMGVDDATWQRGRGHALAQALIFIPYYQHTNPIGVRRAWHAVGEVLADPF